MKRERVFELDQEYLGCDGIGARCIEALEERLLLCYAPLRLGDVPFSLGQVFQYDFAIHDLSVALRVPVRSAQGWPCPPPDPYIFPVAKLASAAASCT